MKELECLGFNLNNLDIFGLTYRNCVCLSIAFPFFCSQSLLNGCYWCGNFAVSFTIASSYIPLPPIKFIADILILRNVKLLNNSNVLDWVTGSPHRSITFNYTSKNLKRIRNMKSNFCNIVPKIWDIWIA